MAALPRLDDLGLPALGDVAAVRRAVLAGEAVALVLERPWPLPAFPPTVTAAAEIPAAGPVIVVTDRALPPRRGLVVLHPPTLVLGVGASRGADTAELDSLITGALAEAGLAEASVAAVVTAEIKADEPALRALARRLGVPLRTFAAERLARQPVPNPSAVVLAAVGTPSVAEASVLASGATLVLPKRVATATTVAVGRLPVVGHDAGTVGGVDTAAADPADLEYHGDQAVGPGLLDLAVNVRAEPAPRWLTAAVTEACGRLAAYPDPAAATAAVAARHGRPPAEVLLTAGAAEAFGLIARVLASGHPAGGAAVGPASGPAGGPAVGPAAVVHPQFTEPERALRAAGHPVLRHVLRPGDGFRLDPAAVPPGAGAVVIGNPTNPTGVLHRADALRALSAPGRLLVVDEAFMDAVPGEPESLAGRRDVPGLLVVRSLTKTWGLAGLRIGYLLGPAPLIARLRAQQPPWAVSTPALAAALACSTDRAAGEAAARAELIERRREALRHDLAAFGLPCVPDSRGPFLLVRGPAGRCLTDELRGLGIAVRRADTFPGLGPEWFRVAARDETGSAALLAALDTLHLR